MPGIGPIRNSAPIKQAAAKQELEAVRHQLSRFKNDVQVRLLVSESGRLQVSRVSGRAPEQDPDEKAQASQRLLDLLRTQGENPDGQLLGERLSRNQLITLIDRYHKPPASGRSFHGAKLIYGNQQVARPEVISQDELNAFISPDAMRRRALDRLAARLGMQELPQALENYFQPPGRRRTREQVDAADAIARRLRPPPDGSRSQQVQGARDGNERPDDSQPLAQIAFDYDDAYILEQDRSSRLKSLSDEGSLTPQHWEALTSASTLQELEHANKAIRDMLSTMPKIDAYLAPREGRSLKEKTKHLFFKIGALVNQKMGDKLGSARIARSLSDLIGSVRRQSAQADPDWQDCAAKLGRLTSRLVGMRGDQGRNELALHMDALLDKVDEIDQIAHLGQPLQLKALSEALLNSTEQLAARNAPPASLDVLRDLTTKVSDRLKAHAIAPAEEEQDQGPNAVARGLAQKKARAALAHPSAAAKLEGLLSLYRESIDFIEEENLHGKFLDAKDPGFQTMLAGIASMSDAEMAGLSNKVAQAGRAGLRLITVLRAAAGGPIPKQQNDALHRLMPLSCAVSALKQTPPDIAVRDWRTWVYATAVSHGGRLDHASIDRKIEAALRQPVLARQYTDFLDTIAREDLRDIRNALRTGDPATDGYPSFRLLEKLALGEAGRALAPDLSENIRKAADAFNNAGESLAQRETARTHLEQYLMSIPQQGQRFSDAEVARLGQAALDAVHPPGVDQAAHAQQLADLLPPSVALRAITALDSGEWADDEKGELRQAFSAQLTSFGNRTENLYKLLKQEDGPPALDALELMQEEFQRLQGLLSTYASAPPDHASLKSDDVNAVKVLAVQTALAMRSTAQHWLRRNPAPDGAARSALESIANADLPEFIGAKLVLEPDGLGVLVEPIKAVIASNIDGAPIDSALSFENRLLIPNKFTQALAGVPPGERANALMSALQSAWRWDRRQGEQLIDALPVSTLRTYADQIDKSKSNDPAIVFLKARLQSVRRKALDRLQQLADRFENNAPPVSESELPSLLSQAYLDAQAALEMRAYPDNKSSETMSDLRTNLKRIAVAIDKIVEPNLWILKGDKAGGHNLSNKDLGLFRLALIACGSIFSRDLSPDRMENPFSNAQSRATTAIRLRFKDEGYTGLDDILAEELISFKFAVGYDADSLYPKPLSPGLEKKVAEFFQRLLTRLATTFDPLAGQVQEFGSHISESLRFALLPEHQDAAAETARNQARTALIAGDGSSMRTALAGSSGRLKFAALRDLYELAAINPGLKNALDNTEAKLRTSVDKRKPKPSRLLMLEMLEVLKAEGKADHVNEEKPGDRYEKALRNLLRRPETLNRGAGPAWQTGLFPLGSVVAGMTPTQREEIYRKVAQSALDSLQSKSRDRSTSAEKLLRDLPRVKPDDGLAPMIHEALRSIASEAELELRQQAMLDTGALGSPASFRDGQGWNLLEGDLKKIRDGKGIDFLDRPELEGDEKAALAALHYLRLIQREDENALDKMTPRSLLLLKEMLQPIKQLWTVGDLLTSIEERLARA